MSEEMRGTESALMERGRARAEPLRQPDPIGAWLDVLSSLLRVSPGERRAIRDELDSHLRDRVRDIMLTGLDEVRATRDAIGELGDAAELAARYGRATRTPSRRRLAMNMGMLGVAGAALLTSMVALNDAEQPTGLSVYPGGAGRTESAAVSVGAIRAEGDPLADVLSRIAANLGVRLVVDWESLAPLGVEPVSEVRIDVPGGSMDEVLRAIGDGLTRGEVPESAAMSGEIDHRLSGGVLRVASGRAFDLSERVLATIDVSAVLESGVVSEEEITSLVTGFIEPEQWSDNGGDVSSLSIVGGRIFVKAPPRIIEGVRWIVGQLSAPAQVEPEQVVPERASAAIEGRLIALENTAAMEMAEVLRAAGTVSERLRIVSRERAIAVDAGSNALWVRSTAAQIEAIEEIVRVLDAEGPLEDRAITESRTVKLERARAAEVRHVLGLALNANPRMKQCAVPRSFEVDASENTLTVTATPGQVDTIARMASALDR